MAKIKLICEVCGQEYEKYPSQIKNNKHFFCSQACYLKYHSRNVSECVCEVCGKTFKSKGKNANRFCSRDCYNQYHNIQNKIRKCPTCGKDFEAKSSEDKYCSWDCYNKDRHPPRKDQHWNWQGGISLINDRRDSTEYKEWRQKVYTRDNFRCVKCGSKLKLNAHHIKSWKYYPELRYELSNGITLCEKCHVQLHQKYGFDTKEEVI